MYACMQRFISGGESALVSSMGNEIISLRLLIILLPDSGLAILNGMYVCMQMLNCYCVIHGKINNKSV